jgi:regulator of nonsense transcripts 3
MRLWQATVFVFFSCDLQQYVLQENAKEKPTYILVPKRDEHAQREKDATSGGISGSAHVAENKKEKIVLLKGRARVDSNVSI